MDRFSSDLLLLISWRTSSSHRGTMGAIVLRWNADFLHFLGFFLSFCILDSVLMLFLAFPTPCSYRCVQFPGVPVCLCISWLICIVKSLLPQKKKPQPSPIPTYEPIEPKSVSSYVSLFHLSPDLPITPPLPPPLHDYDLVRHRRSIHFSSTRHRVSGFLRLPLILTRSHNDEVNSKAHIMFNNAQEVAKELEVEFDLPHHLCLYTTKQTRRYNNER
ncbi:hypothetical protein QL285_093075 [Trifolium repens]|nr:hypothetical protein QL285_093075 [Trifolium repens]